MDDHRIHRLSGLASEFDGQLEEFQEITTRFSDANKEFDLDGISTVGEKWLNLLENVEGFSTMKLMNTIGKDVCDILSALKEKLQNISSMTSFPQEPTPGNENTALLSASFTTITTLLNNITEDPSGTIGTCPFAACYADKVVKNIHALKGDAKKIAQKTLELDPSKVIEEIKCQFCELENTMRHNLTLIINLDLKTTIEKALTDDDLKVAEEQITQVADDVTTSIGFVSDGMSELMTTAQETCGKKIDEIKSIVKDVQAFAEKAANAFEPPICTSLCFFLCCSYPDIKEEIDESLQKSRSALESTGDMSVLNAIKNRVNSFPVKDILTLHKQFDSIGMQNLSVLLKVASAMRDLKLIVGDAQQHMGFDIKKAIENMTEKTLILLDFVKNMDCEPLKDVVVKCEKLTRDKSPEAISEVVDALETAQESSKTEEITNMINSMYQATDVVKKFSHHVEKVIDVSSKTLELLSVDQDEDEFMAMRSALALLSTSGDIIEKTNDMCSSCLEAASKGEGLKSFVRDLDEIMESLHGSLASLAKAGGGLMALKGAMNMN